MTRVWLVEMAEPLPVDRGSRLWRVGMLAERLARAGHDVTWWTSDFDHFTKTHRNIPGGSVAMGPSYRIRLLAGPGYRRNVSLARMRHHRALADAFARAIASEPVPAVIHSCLPTLEVCDVAVQYGQARGIPVVVDVRDRWPDIFLGAVPPLARPLARLVLGGEFRRARRVLRGAAAILAVSETYLDWGLEYAGRNRREDDGVFPHGYAPAGLTPEQRARGTAQLQAAGVDAARTICCFVGTFGQTYDLAPVISAARTLGHAGPQFVLAGTGEREQEWRALANGTGNVVFTGWLPAEGVAVLLEQADIALAAYAAGAPQGLPNKVIEYLSAGLPVLSTLRGETEDLLAEAACGVTYQAGSTEALLAALGPLAASAERRAEMGRRARARFEAEFGADRVYGGLADRLARLAKSRK